MSQSPTAVLVLVVLLGACGDDDGARDTPDARADGMAPRDAGSRDATTDARDRDLGPGVDRDSGDLDTGTPDSGTPRERAGLLLELDFEGDDPFGAVDTNQSCCEHSITQSTDVARTGLSSFCAEVREDDPAVSAGWRAELTFPDLSDTGERWYGWSVYFVTPSDGGHWLGSYGGHFVQWHPDNSGGSASLALWGSDGIWELHTNPEGDSDSVRHGDGREITSDVWHDVVMHVDWDEGIVQLWLDGELYVDLTDVDYASGPGQYMKFGMNRWGDGRDGGPTDTWRICYDDLRIGDERASYEDVAP